MGLTPPQTHNLSFNPNYTEGNRMLTRLIAKYLKPYWYYVLAVLVLQAIAVVMNLTCRASTAKSSTTASPRATLTSSGRAAC